MYLVMVCSLLLSANTMASVIGLPVRCSRLKIINLKQLTRNFSANSTINRRLNSGQPYWLYLLGGSVCAGVYFKWQELTSTVTAFNPKKIKVSARKLSCSSRRKRKFIETQRLQWSVVVVGVGCFLGGFDLINWLRNGKSAIHLIQCGHLSLT